MLNLIVHKLKDISWFWIYFPKQLIARMWMPSWRALVFPRCFSNRYYRKCYWTNLIFSSCCYWTFWNHHEDHWCRFLNRFALGRRLQFDSKCIRLIRFRIGEGFLKREEEKNEIGVKAKFAEGYYILVSENLNIHFLHFPFVLQLETKFTWRP